MLCYAHRIHLTCNALITLGVIQGTFGIVQGTFGILQGTLSITQGTFALAQATYANLQETFAITQGTALWNPIPDLLPTSPLHPIEPPYTPQIRDPTHVAPH